MAPTTHISLWSLFLIATLLTCIVQAGQLPRQPEGWRQSLAKHPTQESQQDYEESPGTRHQNFNSQDRSWLDQGGTGELGTDLIDWLRATVGPGETGEPRKSPNSPALSLSTPPPLSSVANFGTPPGQDSVPGAVWMGPPPRQEGYRLVDKLGTRDTGGRDMGVKFWVAKGPISKDRRGSLNSEQTPGQMAPFPLAAGSPEESPALHLFPTVAPEPRTQRPHPKVSTVQEKVEVLSKGVTGPTPEGIPREDLGWKVVSRDDDLNLQGPLAAQAPALSWVPFMTTDQEHQPPSSSPVIPGASRQLIMQTGSVTLRTMNSYVPFPIDHTLSPTVRAGEGKTAKAQSWSGEVTPKGSKQGSPKPGGRRSWSEEAQAPQVITEKNSMFSVLRPESLLKPERTSSAPGTSQDSRSLPIWISANHLPSVLTEEPDLRTGRWSNHFAHQISTQKAPLSLQTEDSDNEGNSLSATLLTSSRSPSPSPVSNTTAPLSPGHQPGPETGLLEGAELISPQRVRGAVESPNSQNSTTPSTPAPERMTNATKSLPAAGPPGVAERQPGERPPQSHPPAPPASSRPSLTTTRRGLIRVTTQRALGQPNAPEPSPSPEVSDLPPDATCGPRACGPQANETSSPPLRWGPLRHTLSFAWELHVYGAGAFFLLLAFLALAGLVAAAVTPHVPGRAHALAAAALVLAASLLRAIYLLADPYGSRGRLAARTGLVLYNLPFPLLVTALGALALLGLGQLLPPRLRSLRLLGALGAVHWTLLLGADLLSPWLRPPLNLLVQGLSCAWGAGVALGTLLLCRRWLLGAVEVGPEGHGRSRAPGPGPRVLAVGGALGLLASGLQLAAAVWLYPLAGTPSRFSWPWWGVQFWLRLVELAWAAALALVAGVASCRWGPRPTEHTCWGKLLHYACPPPGKNEVPEYPNNCYDWTGTPGVERCGTDISKSLIRNPAESGGFRPPKDSNELRAGQVLPSPAGSAASLARAGRSPKYPNNVGPGRSRSSVCLDKTAGPSLSELDLRPPSPINLSRSIDEALFREHLVRDSVFLRSSLQYPAGLGRRDSAASLQALSQPGGPLLRQRRSSDPDRSGLTPQDRYSSLTDVRVVPKPAPEPEAGAASGSSLDSFSKGSLKISWNPWRHGLSSVESLPLDELPSTVQLLPSQAEPEPVPALEEPGDPEREARRSFLALSKQVDSRSASSETIEL
ncbi:proline-rich transmembrane protein 3 [Phascolarctos cinereus]|uniref:Proline-rich transmembrane protein 3 n=1 Tax=Phascolarctos cinereus TaxID=38626 RepID=A0A6P5JR99_PHACI|nr:proline-rich transmembrane protein 3 [Phascolarctos cinereus]XP_020836661.1 proline-rich transmembrane protein 3 [Phascolarctos cinereus]